MKFYVEPEVFETLDGVCFGVVAVSGIDNTVPVAEISSLLDKNVAECEAYFEDKKVKESKEVDAYREAFRKMGFNPNKFMCSIEALLTRISKKKGMPSINPAVDLGNAVSLKYKVPLGAHDLNSSTEDFCVRLSRPDDEFIPFGETEHEATEEKEIVYASGRSIRTRRWIWRQSEAGKITENTSTILFPIDGFEGENKEEVLAARDELVALLKQFYDCKICTGWIDKDHREFEIEL